MLWSPQLYRSEPRRIVAASSGVAVDASSITEQYKASAGTQTLTGGTIAAGSNLALVVSLDFDASSTTPTVTSLVWDAAGANQALSLIKAVDGTGGGKGSQLWGLVGVTPGASKSITLTTTSSSAVFMAAIAFSGVNQSGGTTSFPGSVDSSGGNFSTLTVASASGDIVVGTCSAASALGTVTGTAIFNDSSTGSTINAFSNYMSGAASVAIGQSNTLSNVTCSMVATNIKAA